MIWAYCRNSRAGVEPAAKAARGEGAARVETSTSGDVAVGDPRGVPIKDVAQILGVPMPTLRSWELRYGIPTLSRGPGQHRRYLPEEVNALRLMRDEIARGQHAGVAAQSVRRLLGGQGPAQELILQILGAAERLDAASIRARLDEASATLGLAACIDDVLLPATRQIGVWWAVGHCDVVQERMATEAVRAWLDRRSAFAPAPTRSASDPAGLRTQRSAHHRPGINGGAVAVSRLAVPGARGQDLDRHAGGRGAGHRGCRCRRGVPTGDRATPRRRIDPRHRRSGYRVFYAGDAFVAPRSRRGVPGRYLGGGIEDACVELTRALAPTGPGPEVHPSI